MASPVGQARDGRRTGPNQGPAEVAARYDVTIEDIERSGLTTAEEWSGYRFCDCIPKGDKAARAAVTRI
jgi:hypothetical protein